MDTSKIKIDGSANLGDLHRAISLASKMRDAGMWDGVSTLIFLSGKIVNEVIAETQLTGKLQITSENYKII